MSSPFGTNNPGIGGLDELTSIEEAVVASIASFGSAGQSLIVNAGADGVEWSTPAGGGDVSAASNFGTDNVLVRSDGTTKGVQSSGIVVDDSDNVDGIGSMTVSEMAAPGTPASGKVVIYSKTDGKLYIKDDAGTETDLTSGGGGGTVDVVSNVATDRILGRTTAGSGDSEELTASAVSTLIDSPIISSSAGSPVTTPSKVGNINIDTTGDQIYLSVDTSASTDWKQLIQAIGWDDTGLILMSTATDGVLANTDIYADDIVTGDSTDTFTNKTFDADGTGNSITNIENANIKTGAAIDAAKVHDGTVSNTEFGYLNGVTSAIQTQLDGKKATGADETANVTAATTSAAGIVELATGAEAVTGTDTSRALTPDALTDRILGRTTAGSGDSEELTASAVSTLIDSPIISSSAGSPVTTPSKVGNINIDTTGDQIYLSVDTSASTDWKQLIQAIGWDDTGLILMSTATDGVLANTDIYADDIVTGDSTDTFTNKTFDADGTGNSITNIENANIKTGAAIDAAKVHDGTVSNTEFGYLNGVTSAIQTQLDGKKATGADETANVTAATTSAAGIVELATGAEAVTGTDTSRALTPDALTDRIAAPGAIGGTTPATRIDYDRAVGSVNAIGNLGATETIDWSTDTHFTGNLDANITFTNSNSVTGQSITLYLTYSGAQRTITWPTTTWLDNATGAAPTTPSASGNVLVVTLQNIGGTIYGSATGNYAVYA